MSQHMPHSGHDVHSHAHGHADADQAGQHGHHGDHHHGPEGHVHAMGFKGWLQELFVPHAHDAADSIDTAMEASSQGIRAVKFSLLGLGATSIFQLVIVLTSGSVALLADTVHNFSDALTAVPLWIAFLLGRRATTRTYTYGFGRAEDLAGLFIVAMIALSAVVAAVESIRRFFEPQPVQNLGWVLVAGIVGSPATSSLPSTAYASAGRSAPPHWSQTASTPGPTDSPLWPSSAASLASGSDSPLPTPSWGC